MKTWDEQNNKNWYGPTYAEMYPNAMETALALELDNLGDFFKQSENQFPRL